MCISGYKLDDCTGDGLAGWDITLYNETGVEIGDETTDADGYYEFCDLEAGEYTVVETPMTGYYPISAPSTITLTCESVGNQNFSNHALMCISGTKYDYDTEEEISGITIILYDDGHNELDRMDTLSDGSYEFCGLEAGTYTVEEDLPIDWVEMSSPDEIILDCYDSTGNDFYNRHYGSLKVTKTIDYEDWSELPDQEFFITVTGPSYPIGIDLEFELDNGHLYNPDGLEAPYCLENLIVGTYHIEEINVPDGWELLSIIPSTVSVTHEDGNDCSNAVLSTVTNRPTLGCTLTPGYWKTHSHHGPAPEDETWFDLGDVDGDGTSEGADELFFDTGKTYYQIMMMSASSGNAYVNLAQKYIATVLTSLMDSNPNDLPDDIETKMFRAEELLDQYDTTNPLDIPKTIPNGKKKVQNPDRAEAIAIASTLDNFLNGNVPGWPHCDGGGPTGPAAICQTVITLLTS